jgi:hypothetical protein
MKPLFLAALLLATGCTYNVVQQQNGSSKGSQLVTVGGEGEHGVTAIQGPGVVYPLPRYPQGTYQGGGYNKESYNGGPIGPAYPPDPAGIPYPLPIPAFHSEANIY